MSILILKPDPATFRVSLKSPYNTRFNFFIKMNVHTNNREWSTLDHCWQVDPPALLHILPHCRKFFTKIKAESLSQRLQEQIQSVWGDDSAPTISSVLPPNVVEAFKTFHLLPSAPVAVMQSVFRTLSIAHHPDSGGDHEHMVKLNVAHQVLETFFKSQAAEEPQQNPQGEEK